MLAKEINVILGEGNLIIYYNDNNVQKEKLVNKL